MGLHDIEILINTALHVLPIACVFIVVALLGEDV